MKRKIQLNKEKEAQRKAMQEENSQYEKTSYFKITHTDLSTLKSDMGKYGEYLTYKALSTYENSGSEFLFNLYIPTEENKTSEIDMVMISCKGIFVFESKNFSGWIFGNEFDLKWTQTLPTGQKSKKSYFYNPVKQNKVHTEYLQKVIGNDIPVYSVIVFSDECTLKDIYIKRNNVQVINRRDLFKTVSDVFNYSSFGNIPQDKIQKIYSELYPYTQVNSEVKYEHIKDIKSRQILQPVNISSVLKSQENAKSETENQICALSDKENMSDTNQEKSADPAEEMVCPKCGGKLVIRKAMRGANAGNRFYGCSNYPKCTYIKNITESANNQ